MKIRLLLGILFFALFFSCKEEERMTLPDPTDSSTRYDIPEADFISQIDIAEDATAQWSVFNELKSTLASIPKADLRRIRTQSEKLTHYSDSLRKTIPTSLKTMPIKTRLDVVHARIELLNMTANNLLVDSLELKENYKETLLAFNTLLHQINEKYEKDAIQKQGDKIFSHELQQRTKDSIFKIEQARKQRQQ